MQTQNIVAFVLDATPIIYEERRIKPKMIPIYETDTIDLNGIGVVRHKKVNGIPIPVYDAVYLEYDDDIRPCSFRYLEQGIATAEDDDEPQFNTDDYC